MQSATFDHTQQWVLNPYLSVIVCGDDELLVKHGSRSIFSKTIQDEGRSKLLGRTVRYFKTPSSLLQFREKSEFTDVEMESVSTLMEYLVREDVLVDPATDTSQIYIDAFLGRSGALDKVAVGIIGCAYLGSRIAIELSQLDIGRMVLVDDRICPRDAVASGLHRAPMPTTAGRPFVQSLAEHLTRLGYPRIEAHESSSTDVEAIRKLAATTDVLIVALESSSPAAFHKINEVMLEENKPWLAVCFDGSEALIGPVFVPGETCCYNEFEIQHEAATGALRGEVLLYREALDDEAAKSPAHLIFSPYAAIASGFAVIGLVRFLVTGKTFLVGRCIRVDFERLSVDSENILRLPRCPACHASRPYRHLFL